MIRLYFSILDLIQKRPKTADMHLPLHMIEQLLESILPPCQQSLHSLPTLFWNHHNSQVITTFVEIILRKSFKILPTQVCHHLKVRHL